MASKPDALTPQAVAAMATRHEWAATGVSDCWAAAGFMDTLLRWKMEPEVTYEDETAVQPGVQA